MVFYCVVKVAMKRKKKSREDDRKNFNDDLVSDFKAFQEFNRRAIRCEYDLSPKDIHKAKKEYGLNNLNRLLRYLSCTDWGQLSNDSMLQWIDSEFRKTIEEGHLPNANLGESERSWLTKLGLTGGEVDELNQLIDGQDVRGLFTETNQGTIKVLRQIVKTFKDQFNQLNFDELARDLDDIKTILAGTSLICEDGLKIYNPGQPSVNSIKAGFLIFVNGANSFLQRYEQAV